MLILSAIGSCYVSHPAGLIIASTLHPLGPGRFLPRRTISHANSDLLGSEYAATCAMCCTYPIVHLTIHPIFDEPLFALAIHLPCLIMLQLRHISHSASCLELPVRKKSKLAPSLPKSGFLPRHSYKPLPRPVLSVCEPPDRKGAAGQERAVAAERNFSHNRELLPLCDLDSPEPPHHSQCEHNVSLYCPQCVRVSACV